MEAVASDELVDKIDEKIKEKMHRRTPRNEIRSWQNSMQYMYHVIENNDIPNDCGIAIEYNIPQTSKRVDFMISGYDASQNPSVVIVELKQWESAEPVHGMEALVRTYIANSLRTVVHPCYQVWSYAVMIEDFNTSVQNKDIKLYPCAFLHNFRKDNASALTGKQYEDYIRAAPMFLKKEGRLLTDYIKKSIKTGDNQKILFDIDNGKMRPSKSLQNSIAKIMEGNSDFIMLDDQKVAYEEILNTALVAKKENRKHVIIVKGGPGTGKSVIAINLLAQLILKDEQLVQYVSKNSAPRTVYGRKLTEGRKMTKTSIQNLFTSSGSFTNTSENYFDTLLCDEAHRLNEKSGLFHNKGENQVKEIIQAAKCSVFFLDENQRVTLSDIGNSKIIHQFARELEADVSVLRLSSQFRCNGSDGYLAWVDNVLQIRETANYNMDDIDYDLKILNSPQEVYDLIKEKNEKDNNSRLLAGYCWDWKKDGKQDSNVHDIEIGDFGISWNLKDGIYAMDKGSINQAGCIHTTQGLEFNYVGVIIGEDLRCENGKIITDFNKRAKTDQSLRGIKKMYKEDPKRALKEADEIIKNTYRTLMTRGMKGCYIYCCDNELSEYLKAGLK